MVCGAASHDVEADAAGAERGTLVLSRLWADMDAGQALMIHKESCERFGGVMAEHTERVYSLQEIVQDVAVSHKTLTRKTLMNALRTGQLIGIKSGGRWQIRERDLRAFLDAYDDWDDRLSGAVIAALGLAEVNPLRVAVWSVERRHHWRESLEAMLNTLIWVHEMVSNKTQLVLVMSWRDT